LPANQKVVQLSILGFPTSNPSPVINSLDHGLEAPCHQKAQNRARSFRIIAKGVVEPHPSS